MFEVTLYSGHLIEFIKDQKLDYEKLKLDILEFEKINSEFLQDQNFVPSALTAKNFENSKYGYKFINFEVCVTRYKVRSTGRYKFEFSIKTDSEEVYNILVPKYCGA
jgi:hypothetical protein